MELKGQGKINICGVEYKKDIADSRRGGGGPSTPKKTCIRACFIGPVSILVGALCPMRYLLPSGHNVTSKITGEAATIRQPEEHPGLLMAIC